VTTTEASETTETTGLAPSVTPAPGDAGDLDVGTAARTSTTEAPATLAPVVVTAPPPRRPGLVDRARADGVTGPAVVALAALLVAGGVALDLRRDATLGLGTGVAFVLAATAAPAVVRFRSLATAAVLPPLLFVGAVLALARLGGQDRGLREIGLDVGTTLALSAPLLFAGTALGLVVVLARIVRRVAARR
jgi:hypothetical protein